MIESLKRVLGKGIKLSSICVKDKFGCRVESGFLVDKYKEGLPIVTFFFYINQSNCLDQDVKCEWIPDISWRWTQQDWLLTDEESEKKRGTGKRNSIYFE